MTISLCPSKNSALLSMPGFRFHPTDIELLSFYLKRKIAAKPIPKNTITELDIYQYPPWDLPIKSAFKSDDPSWYFFCPNHTKYRNGSSEVNRATGFGYWKGTGKDREICYAGKRIGWDRILVFHMGKPKKGENQRTDWVMHEYRLHDSDQDHNPFVLCKVFKKSGLGPRKSREFGAPFAEQDWDDEEEEEKLVGGKQQNNSVRVELSTPISTATTDQIAQDENDRDFEAYLLDVLDFEDDSVVVADEREGDDTSRNNDIQSATVGDQKISRQNSGDIFKNLDDLDEWKDFNAGRSCSYSGIQYYCGDDVHFMEVADLDPSLSSWILI